MGGVAVTLLNLIITHVAELIEAVSLQHVDHSESHREGLVAEETFLHHKSQANVVTVVAGRKEIL